MGNQGSSSLTTGNQRSLTTGNQRSGTYGSIRHEDADQMPLNTSDWDSSEYPSSRNRKIALTGILLSQSFLYAALNIIIVWIPQTVQLNAYWWFEGDPGYYDYMYK